MARIESPKYVFTCETLGQPAVTLEDVSYLCHPFDFMGPGGRDLQTWMDKGAWLTCMLPTGTIVRFDQLNWIWAVPVGDRGHIDYLMGTAVQAVRHARYRKIPLDRIMAVPESRIHGSCVREEGFDTRGFETYRLVQSRAFHAWTWEWPSARERGVA